GGAPMPLLALWIACATAPPSKPGDPQPADDTDPAVDTPDDTDPAQDTPVDTAPDCAPRGTSDCPFVVPRTPWSHTADTSIDVSDAVDRWACAPDTDESGPELYYAFDAPAAGIVSFRVLSDEGVDIDVHIARAPDGASCASRGHIETAWYVQPGRWYLVADSWVDGGGAVLSGGYTVFVDFLRLDEGPCALAPRDLEMYWSGCALELDCDPTGARPVLHTPSIGPTVLEAHLVTDAEDFGGGWPGALRDQIARHYGVSEAASGWPMTRSQPWAPAGEGGSQYGQAAYGRPLPVLDEAWYVNMYWRDRPTPGTRMILVNPYTGDAVVAAGGYETGPGDGDHIGGASEEIHDALATTHLDDVLFGFAADPTLPLGPIRCW
ncbi:MAG TPA: hypothetical protein PKA64_02435, partial [Myxococcota bacterium]|nr:hypothetical protein [Myxococcota bacterium]